MGILSNTASICQFKVTGDMSATDLFTWAGESLGRNGFRSIDHTAEELSVGWVHIEDAKESGFESPRAFRRDHYIAFTLRRDQRRVPSALFKSHMEMAEHEFLVANPGLQRVPKQKKEDLREAVRGALLAKTLPAPAIYDAVWDTRSGLITFTCLSAKMVEQFENLFKQTFEGLRLVAVHPFARAEEVLEDDLKLALGKANGASTDAVLDLIRDNRWLGWDFLLWLMYRTMNEASGYRVSLPGPALDQELFVAYLNDRLILIGGGESGVQKITVAGPQDNFREVRTALQNGKQINEAIIYLEKQEHLWKMTLKGELFQFASYKAPPVKIEKDNRTDETSEREAVFYERMYVLEEGLQLFDSLYAAFLGERLGEGWSEQERKMEDWLSAD
jgi:hypothetical protein